MMWRSAAFAMFLVGNNDWEEPLGCPLLVGIQTTFGGTTPLIQGPVYESRAVGQNSTTRNWTAGLRSHVSIYQGKPFWVPMFDPQPIGNPCM